MEQVIIKSLEQVSVRNITDAFNHAFSDYMVPVNLAEAHMQLKMRQEQIDPQWSMGAFDGDRLVGLVLHGLRRRDGVLHLYNGGTGVCPGYRGRKLTQSMYAWLLPKAVTHGVGTITLEAITTNSKALHVYDEIGFKKTRHYLLWKGSAPVMPGVKGLRMLVDPPQLSFPDPAWFDQPPYWSADAEAMAAIRNEVLGMVALMDDQPAGYLYMLRHNARLLQLAVRPPYRRLGMATAMLARAFEELGLTDSLALNVDINNVSANAFFEGLGWKQVLEQYEMRLTLQG